MGIKEGKFQKIILLALLVMPMLLASTHQQGSAESRILEKEISVLQEAAARNDKQLQVILNDISSLEYKVALNKKVIYLINGNKSITDEDFNSLSNQLSALNEERATAIAQYQVILLEEYKNRDYKSKLYFLASSSSLSELVNRISHLNKLKRLRQKQLEMVEAKRQEVQNKLAIYGGSYEDKTQLAEKKVLDSQKLNENLREKHLKAKELERNGNVLMLEIRKKKHLFNTINKPKRKKNDSFFDKENKTAKKKFSWPVKTGLVVEQFGVHKHSVERKVQIENNGIDILVSGQEAIYSIANGNVKAILEVPGLHSSIIIDHGKFHSVYSNISDVLVRTGETVGEGMIIGRISASPDGLSKLHFELWEGLKKRNPEEYLKGVL